MKKIKKLAAAFLTLCLLSPCISTVVHAAAAQLRFTDPSTTVGAEVEIKAKVTASSSIKSVDATLTYDASMLKFKSGDDATGGDGTVTIAGTQTGTDVTYLLKFQALKEGTAKVEVSSASGTTASGDSLEITNGSSSVTIGPGDPSLITDDEQPADGAAPAGSGPQVTVNDVNYTISNEFSDALLPTGFSKAEMTYEGTNCQVVKQDTGEATAVYLQPADGGEADFFLYDGDKGKFSPFQQVDISQDRYIIFLTDDGSVKLPASYQKTTLTIDGKEFPVWQDTDHSDYYVVNALNSDGQKQLYQYDNTDKTYQRYIKSNTVSSEDKTSPKGLWGKILNVIKNHMDLFAVAGAALFLVFLIILIVVGIKLHHRNVELDDLYDEYGIDMDEEEEPKKAAPKKKAEPKKAPVKSSKKEMKPAVRRPLEEDIDDFEEEDYEDEDFEEEDFDENDFDDSDFENAFDDEYADYEDEEEDGQYVGDYAQDEIEDLDDLLGENAQRKRGHMEDDDAFKVDFIDLD